MYFSQYSFWSYGRPCTPFSVIKQRTRPNEGLYIRMREILCWISPTITPTLRLDVYSVLLLKTEYTSNRKVECYGGRNPALVCSHQVKGTAHQQIILWLWHKCITLITIYLFINNVWPEFAEILATRQITIHEFHLNGKSEKTPLISFSNHTSNLITFYT